MTVWQNQFSFNGSISSTPAKSFIEAQSVKLYVRKQCDQMATLFVSDLGDNNNIIYPNTINIKGDKKELKLRSIILHKGLTIHSGHYTTIIKKDRKTYEYDDIRSTDNKLVEIDENYERKMRRNVVALIYSR